MWLRNMSTFTGGPVYSVNIDPNEIPGIEALGFKNYARLTDISGPVDFAVVAVPRRAAPLVLRDAITKGVAGVSMFTAGFAETAAEEGRQLQQTITTMAREANLALIGPNWTSVVDDQGVLRLEDPDDFIVLSGDDALTLPLMAVGGRGIISVAANEIPSEMVQMVEAAERNDFTAARRIHARIMPLLLANFVESNPIPVKAAMAAMGLLEEVYRLPMVPPQPASREKLEKVLRELGLLKGALV
jgi:hypothetical protein